ncbi:MAG: hypothetical protein KDE56_28590 [Anaerolineales bacterium]|nr:hypothetical protein [Anaerolineales bacterium]
MSQANGLFVSHAQLLEEVDGAVVINGRFSPCSPALKRPFFPKKSHNYR